MTTITHNANHNGSLSTRYPFKFTGRIAPDDHRHQITRSLSNNASPSEHYLAPTTVNIALSTGEQIGVPQYSPTIVGGSTGGFNPAKDCNGSFASCNFQPNNNCYAYACNIATNTFPQTGRASGYVLNSTDGAEVQSNAEKDGLLFAGKSMADIQAFAQGNPNGHFVALMIAPKGDNNWPGDYHWARCDDPNSLSSWSQKDGPDQVTNFDFAGNPITNPVTANWTVNQGPTGNGTDLVVSYSFYCFMFVPDTGVNIL